MTRRHPPDANPWEEGWPEIHDARVRQAFRRVPRERFVSEEMLPWATCDTALPIREGQTISQPFVVALMTQALGLRPGTRVLEIGTGSGYQTAILCELTAEPQEPLGRTIWTVERYPSLADEAQALLADLGYYPHFHVGDGATGHPVAAPFEGIIVTAGAPAVPRPLWDQLADGGRLVIPVGAPDDGQELWRLTRAGEHMLQERLGPVRFVPLISPILRDPNQRIELPTYYD
jgi:protein-L-isoaspartate(D-aspartate) O-methyltransferase